MIVWGRGVSITPHYRRRPIEGIMSTLRVTITTTEESGISLDWVEAVCFTWLAKQILEKKASNLHSVC
ncbi:anhydro-N-acetylmuramic acid kinase [Coxiella-like endosymbiont]|uniref:anhydro-N-acetylmuramic acid kinase n=1 Tax=Coxiella-like endosymbiont TaxID=1592897 RepID=UPI00272B06C2|nr:anhydro-N-acetylmuramic acid kinase [Coxiella-like endosymbiont]